MISPLASMITPYEALTLVRFIPEILVAATAFILLMGGVFSRKANTSLHVALAVFCLGVLLGLMLIPALPQPRITLFSNMLLFDDLTFFAKLLVIVSTMMAFMLSSQWLTEDTARGFEYPVLMLFSLLGMLLLISAHDLLSLYVALELMSLPLYVLAAFNRDCLRSSEAGLKYFVLGAIGSGMLLFGISLVYGFSGSTQFDAIATVISNSTSVGHVSPGIIVGLVLVMVAFSFKLSAAPFHMWAPDVYHGAPTPVTAFFAMAPKVAACALFVRLMMGPFAQAVTQWQQVVVVIAACSMVVGAFGALKQTNIKRLLAYSSIGHVGFALMGLAAASKEGVASVLLYLVLYVVMSAGAFACVLSLKRGGQYTEELRDLAGLSSTHPRLAFALAVCMFSMAGIPPLAGFFGKLYVFLSALQAGLIGLAIVGVLASVVSCYYYLKVVKFMYFDTSEQPLDTFTAPGVRLVMLATVLVMLLFCVIPTPLVDAATHAAGALLP